MRIPDRTSRTIGPLTATGVRRRRVRAVAVALALVTTQSVAGASATQGMPTPAAPSAKAPVITVTDTTVTPSDGTLACPVSLALSAVVSAAGPEVVRYHWLSTDGGRIPGGTLTFTEPGAATATGTVVLGRSGQHLRGEIRLVALAHGRRVVGEAAGYDLQCLDTTPPRVRLSAAGVTVDRETSADLGDISDRDTITFTATATDRESPVSQIYIHGASRLVCVDATGDIYHRISRGRAVTGTTGPVSHTWEIAELRAVCEGTTHPTLVEFFFSVMATATSAGGSTSTGSITFTVTG
ncbi:MAG: hypothetical protein GXX79_07170 [Actinomycetales bacterium]|nr:hypothetical protein [Actinomycetales bacterium]